MRHIKYFLFVCIIVLFLPLNIKAATETTAGSVDNSNGTGDEEQIKINSVSLINELVNMTDDQISEVEEKGTDFAKNVLGKWAQVREELGSYDNISKSDLSYEDGIYISSTAVHFSKHDARVVISYSMDQNYHTYYASDFNIEVIYPKDELLEQAGLNTAMGLGIVFSMLVFLSIVIWILGKLAGGKKQKSQEKQRQVAVEIKEPEDISGEVVAVIAAAIAASKGASTDDFVVRSIRRIKGRR